MHKGAKVTLPPEASAADFGRAVDSLLALLAKWKREDEARKLEIAALRDEIEALIGSILTRVGGKAQYLAQESSARHKRRGSLSSPQHPSEPVKGPD
jgi:hypothetical protein